MKKIEEYLIHVLEKLPDVNDRAEILQKYIQIHGPLSDEAGSKVKEILSR